MLRLTTNADILFINSMETVNGYTVQAIARIIKYPQSVADGKEIPAILPEANK